LDNTVQTSETGDQTSDTGRLCHIMRDSHLPGVSRYVGFVPVKRDGRCAWTGLDGVIIGSSAVCGASSE